ncbi:hypothetical protein ACJIZ3_004154 [Penstemon smallii]|uniref:S-acyltransferase n=1 Tax=Penstemon smallii TaxID=265156 RepID=A0ABD3S194_9LAMI
MDFTNSAAPDVVVPKGDQESTSVDVAFETDCWGCGLRVLVPPYASVFRCGWCGAITKQNAVKSDDKHIRWRRLRDRCFVCVVLIFMLFFIYGGIWAVYPVVFSISYACGVFHLSIAVLLSVSTLSLFLFVASRPAGAPPTILWGSYPTVGKGGLQNYTFCYYCSKPKSPKAHHCRSCGTCIMDMDHHCPFVSLLNIFLLLSGKYAAQHGPVKEKNAKILGNCVGAANHRCFILFLISTVSSTFYVAIMTSYAALYIWPPLNHRPVSHLKGFVNTQFIFRVLKENILSFLRSAVFLHARGLLLVYLFIASFSVSIGLTVLLWHQLSYIYAGKTYLSHLSAVDSNETAEKDCQNLVRFFGCPYGAAIYVSSYWKSRKSHEK